MGMVRGPCARLTPDEQRILSRRVDHHRLERQPLRARLAWAEGPRPHLRAGGREVEAEASEAFPDRIRNGASWPGLSRPPIDAEFRRMISRRQPRRSWMSGTNPAMTVRVGAACSRTPIAGSAPPGPP